MRPSAPVAGLCILITAFLLLAGCERGPEPEYLQRELQQRLDTHFQQGLFAVRKFRRTGSAPFRDLERGHSGVYSYYDAELELQKDYSLTDWMGLNLGTLAYAIGATESGIEGFRAEGNRRGDMLKVHGRFGYSPDGEDGWTPLDMSSGARSPVGAAPVAEHYGPDPAAVVRDIRSLLAISRELKLNAEQALIVEELQTAIGSIDLREARLEGKMTLSSGTPPGTYYSFGEALSRFAARKGIGLFSASSEGSVANASRLQAGRLDFGLVQSDVAQLLYGGLVGEGYYPYKDLRAVASLWPEAVHLLTLKGSGIRSLGDIRGKRVAIGQRGSGSRINALLIGLAGEVVSEHFPAIREISQARAVAQLESGEIDALFLTEAIPARSIQTLASRRDDLRFVSMPPELFVKLSARGFVYYPLEVPAKTYPNQQEPFTTLGLTAALMTHSQVADERVDKLLTLLLSGGDELARQYYRAAFISRETMRLGLSVPLHPAAQRFYQSTEQVQQENPR